MKKPGFYVKAGFLCKSRVFKKPGFYEKTGFFMKKPGFYVWTRVNIHFPVPHETSTRQKTPACRVSPLFVFLLRGVHATSTRQKTPAWIGLSSDSL